MIVENTQTGQLGISCPRHMLDPAIVKAAKEKARSILTSDYPRSPYEIKTAISDGIKKLHQDVQEQQNQGEKDHA